MWKGGPFAFSKHWSPVLSSMAPGFAPPLPCFYLSLPTPPSIYSIQDLRPRNRHFFLSEMKTDGSSLEEGVTVKATRKRSFEGGRRTKRRRVHAASSAIQRLFEACRAVFMGVGTVPPPPSVEMLQLILDGMKPEDVGLQTDLLFFKASNVVKGIPRITYTTIYNCDNFSMCLFFLPPKAVIPLHNHPGMTVFSKLLQGSMHIKSYDWVDSVNSDEHAPSAQSRLARLVVDSDFTAPCDTSILYPTAGGNIHTFIAITPCVVLDVLGPPYSKEDDRDCTYYREHPYSGITDGATAGPKLHKDRFEWLEEIDIPKDLKMDGVVYMGPQIIDG